MRKLTNEDKQTEQVEEVLIIEENNETAVVELAVETEVAVEEESRVKMLDATRLVIDEREYEIVKDYREAFDKEKLGERFSDILGKYDYIVADWGFEQLRLKGFYDDKNKKAPLEQRISTLEDYIYEYCNFGCAYFVLKRIGGKKERPARSKKPRYAKDKNKPVATEQKKTENKRAPKKKSNFTVKKNTTKETVAEKKATPPAQKTKRHFKISKTEEV